MTVLLRNFRLKLLALAFAVAIWSVVAYTENPTQSHKYTLTVTNPVLPAGLALVGDRHPEVTVTVIATADDLHLFDPHVLVVVGNFGHVRIGNNQVPIRVDNSDTSVEVDAPSTITVQVDQLASANAAVTIERLHALPAGVHEQAGATSVTPASVRVDGPKSQLSGISASVEVDLENVTQPGFSAAYTVVVRDSHKKLLNLVVTPAQVTVKMVIQADAITIPKAVGWTLTGQPAAGYRVTNVQISPLQVDATGLENALSAILLLSTDPVDISNATVDVVRTVTIRPPDGVSVAQKTAQVHVFVGKSPGVSPTPTISTSP